MAVLFCNKISAACILILTFGNCKQSIIILLLSTLTFLQINCFAWSINTKFIILFHLTHITWHKQPWQLFEFSMVAKTAVSDKIKYYAFLYEHDLDEWQLLPPPPPSLAKPCPVYKYQVDVHLGGGGGGATAGPQWIPCEMTFIWKDNSTIVSMYSQLCIISGIHWDWWNRNSFDFEKMGLTWGKIENKEKRWLFNLCKFDLSRVDCTTFRYMMFLYIWHL